MPSSISVRAIRASRSKFPVPRISLRSSVRRLTVITVSSSSSWIRMTFVRPVLGENWTPSMNRPPRRMCPGITGKYLLSSSMDIV